MSSRRFSSPFHSIPVPDPEEKGRIARQIPRASLSLLSADLTYIIVPNSRRKRFVLALKPGKYLEVKTPQRYTAADMLDYETCIVSNQEWIHRVQEKFLREEENSPESLSKVFPDRDYILFLGTRYPFHIQYHSTSHQTWVSLEKDHFEIRTGSKDSEELCAALSNWYLKKAKEVLPPLVEAYATAMKLPIPHLAYNRAKSRWAICYPTRNLIRLNVLIMKTPPDCIEYLVVHELSHFSVSNHSETFWESVYTYMPDYNKRRKKLAMYRTVL